MIILPNTEIEVMLKVDLKYEKFMCRLFAIMFIFYGLWTYLNYYLTNHLSMKGLICTFIFFILAANREAKVFSLNKMIEIENIKKKEIELEIRSTITDSYKIVSYDDWKKEYLKTVEKVNKFDAKLDEQIKLECGYSEYYAKYKKEIK